MYLLRKDEEMKKLIKRINWFQLNLSAWIVIIITYIAPYQYLGNNSFTVGLPLKFLTVTIRSWDNSFSISNALNIASLFLDIMIVYLIIALIVRLYDRYLKRKI